MAFVKEEQSGVLIPAGVPTFPVDRIIPPPWNPNKQDPDVFQNLVENIQENGFVDIPQLWPLNTPELREEYLDPEVHDDGPYWLIPGGSHRWEAAKVLGMAVIPGIEVEHWSEDMMKFQNMRLNMLKGQIDPVKFQKLYREMMEKGYKEEVLKVQMGLVKEREFKRLVKETKERLPKEMQKRLEKVEDDLHDIDDLSRVLNELFSKHGDTLDYNYMTFTFGGKTHLWIRMDKPVMEAVQRLTQTCYDEGIDINRVFAKLLKDELPLQDALAEARVETDEDVDFEA